MKYDAIVRDDRLLTILDRYITMGADAEKPISGILKNIADSIRSPELIVPVLGMQGMGKSTLINAILSENILPSDADETTCVPVEIRYGDTPGAKVFFFHGEPKVIDSTCEALQQYVDNNQNNGNALGVSHIALSLPNKLLKGGIVIVDLPGVGSLTKNNQETTMRYIQKLCTAIFIIPTVPTIRRTEEVFIKSAWSSFSSAIFVQNQWNGEADREVQEAVSFNEKVLRSIAKSANVPFDGRICVVNAYQAIYSRLMGNDAVYQASNLSELLALLSEAGENRQAFEEKQFLARVGMAIDTAMQTIRQYQDELKMTAEELRAARQKSEEEFQKHTAELEADVAWISARINQEKQNAARFAAEQAKRAGEGLRADIFKLVDGGIVDGSQLSDAFSDYQQNYSLDVSEACYDYLNELVYELEKLLSNLGDKITLEKMGSFDAGRFDNGQAFKFEKVLEVGVNIGGAIGGVFALLWSAAGPIGTAAGVLAGIGIIVVSSLLGSKTKQAVTARRAGETKRQLQPYIMAFQDGIETTIRTQIDQTLTQVESALSGYIEERKAYAVSLKQAHDQQAEGTYQYRHDESVLDEDISYLTRIGGQLSGNI